MKRYRLPLLTALAAGLTLAACSSGSSSPPKTSLPGNNATQLSDCRTWLAANPSAHVVDTPSYEMVAGIGASEAMYTPSQSASAHPTSGEIMVSGTMDSGGNSMGMGGGGTGMKHLEVHICSKSTGKALTNVMPMMVLQDLAPGGTSRSMPVAEMQGLTRLAADTHYGNNVTVVPGSHYRLSVRVNGETGTFTMSAPAIAQ